MVMTCKVTGYPIPTITFTRNRKRIFRPLIKSDVTIRITRRKPARLSGNYGCTATNDNESASDYNEIMVY